LRNTYNKLESDLSNFKKRYMELVEQRDNLKRGREDSVSYVYLLKHLHYWKHIVPTHAFLQEEREAALEELKTAELHHKKLKVPLSFIEPFFWVGGGGGGLLLLNAAQEPHNDFRRNSLHMPIVIHLH
jgi:hypothetical protein